MHSIRIIQWPLELNATRRETVLDAALRNGVPFPHSCRSGECGECKVRLLSGTVDQESALDGALNQEERQQGYVLACRCQPTSDIKIAWDKEPDTKISIPVKKFKAKITYIQQVSCNVTLIKVKISGEPMAFVAGQYANLSIGKLPARAYSIASMPHLEELEFHIRHVPNGLVSSYVANHLKVGEKIRIEGPYGTSYVRDNHDGPIVAVAGGTGLAPIISIVRQALFLEHDHSIHLYFGVSDEESLYYEGCLNDIAAKNSNVKLHIVLSGTDEKHRRRKGFLHEAIDADITDMSGTKIYAAGPPPMIEALTTIAMSKGAVEEDIHSDPFTASGNKVVAKKVGVFGGVSQIFNL